MTYDSVWKHTQLMHAYALTGTTWVVQIYDLDLTQSVFLPLIYHIFAEIW